MNQFARIMMSFEKVVGENMELVKKIPVLTSCRKDKGLRQEIPDKDADAIAWLYSWDNGEQSDDIVTIYRKKKRRK
jgi:hypothetical protein